MDLTMIGELVKEYGIPIVVAGLFIWMYLNRQKRDDKQQEALANRLAKVEDYQRDKMEKMVTENTDAFRDVAKACDEQIKASQEHSQISRQLIVALRTRRCLAETVDEIEKEAS